MNSASASATPYAHPSYSRDSPRQKGPWIFAGLPAASAAALAPVARDDLDPRTPDVIPPRSHRQREEYNWELIGGSEKMTEKRVPLPVAPYSSLEKTTVERWKTSIDEQWNEQRKSGTERDLVLTNKELAFVPTSVLELNVRVLAESIWTAPTVAYPGLHQRQMGRSVSAPVTGTKVFARTQSLPNAQPRVVSTPAPSSAALSPQPRLAAPLPVHPTSEVSLSVQDLAARASMRTLSRPTVSFAKSSSSSSSSTITSLGHGHAPRLLPGTAPTAEGKPRLLGRVGLRKSLTTGTPSLGPRRPESDQGKAISINLNLGVNLIKVLPSPLFRIEKLVLLSLRNNELSHLPAAISQLVNLRDLNISANKITFLPSTILDMNLDRFTLAGNPFLKRDSPDLTYLPCPSERILHVPASSKPGIPSLSEIILRSLLSTSIDPVSRSLTSAPAFMDDPTVVDCSKELKKLVTAFDLHAAYPVLDKSTCQRIVASLRSALAALPRGDPLAKLAKVFSPLDVPTSEDAHLNPWFSPCPSPRHLYEGEHGEGRRVVFLKPEEVRYEWTAVPGTGGGELYPVRWEGCSRGCLDFLEEAEEEEEEEAAWGVPELAGKLQAVALEQDSSKKEEEEDGFDLDDEDSPF